MNKSWVFLPRIFSITEILRTIFRENENDPREKNKVAKQENQTQTVSQLGIYFEKSICDDD